jgi:hypothetical protein
LAPKQKRKKELELISYDELLGSSSMTGLVSFLEIRPKQESSLPHADVQDIRGAVEQTSSASAAESEQPADRPQKADLDEVSRSLPDSSVLAGSSLPPDSSQQPDGNLPPDSNLLTGTAAGKVRAMPKREQAGLQRISSLLPASELRFTESITPSVPPRLPDSILLSDSNLLPDSDQQDSLPTLAQPVPSSNLLSGCDLQTANGRTVRIRIAKSVQDAHTSAEHMLLTAMWKKGSPETEETRLLRAGLGELSRWTGSHKTSCRAYVRALISKLALEEAETFDAAAGSEGARVYRIFSFNRILERRRRANFTHVIRTGAVSFVDPKTGEKLHPSSNLLPDSTLPPDSNMLTDRKLPSDSGSSHPPIPGSNQRGINKNRQETTQQTTATAVYDALSEYGTVDHAALTRLIKDCKDVAPDCTEQEIVHFIHEKGALTKARDSRILNPIGFLIEAVPKCFAGESLKRYRQARESQQQAQPEQQGREVPTIAAQIESLERFLEEFPNHPQNEENRRRLAVLRNRQGTE